MVLSEWQSFLVVESNQATPSRAPAMNFLARIGEMDPDRTNEEFKDLFDICVDIIADMCTETNTTLSRIQRNEIIESMMEAHYRFRHGDKEREFLLRDVVKVLKEPPRPTRDGRTLSYETRARHLDERVLR